MAAGQQRNNTATVTVVNNAEDASFAGAAVQVRRLLHVLTWMYMWRMHTHMHTALLTHTALLPHTHTHTHSALPGPVGTCAALGTGLQRARPLQRPPQPSKRCRALQSPGRH